MATFYNWEDDQVFGDAIWSYQNNDDTYLLEKWLSNRERIANHKYIEELLFQVFMVHDCNFKNGTSPIFTKAFKICENKIPTNISNEICANAWFEYPQDFKNLFDAYDMVFCNGSTEVLSNRQRTVAECFVGERLDFPAGFWKGVKKIHSAAFFQRTNLANLSENVNTWLAKIPNAKNFVEPYCFPIKGEVTFPHIAYAYLNHGMDIEKNILGLYPIKNPDALESFKRASDFCELNYALVSKDKTTGTRLKL